MRYDDSLDGIRNLSAKRADLKFETRHISLGEEQRGKISPPSRHLSREINDIRTVYDKLRGLNLSPKKEASKTEETKEIVKQPTKTKESPAHKDPGDPASHKKRFWQKKEVQRKFMLAMASIVFICGMAVTGYGIYVNRQVAAVNPPAQEQETSARTVADSDETPSEEPISEQAIREYEVPPDHPRLLKIPKLWLTARVINLGVDEYGNLQTPYSVWDTGWYRDSAKPGEKYGATLIDGHVSGIWGIGVFSKLDTLNKGDEILIERGDRTNVKYRVVSKEIFEKDKVDMKKAIKSVDLTKHGLNIITCNGKYITEEKTFSHRLLVRAVEVD